MSEFLTAGEVAKLLGCTREWVRQLILQGRLSVAHRIGPKKAVLIRRADLAGVRLPGRWPANRKKKA